MYTVYVECIVSSFFCGNMSVNVKVNESYNAIPEKEKLKVLGFDITHYSQTLQLVLCSIAVFFFYILYGYMQELIFTLEGFRPYGWFLTLVQFGFYTIFGLTEKHASRIAARK